MNLIFKNYGYDKIFLLKNLQKIGLFEVQDSILKREESKANILKSMFTSDSYYYHVHLWSNVIKTIITIINSFI